MKPNKVISRLTRMCSTQTQRQVAEALNISPSYLSDILLGKREPGPTVLAALGLVRHVDYRDGKSELVR